MSHRFTRQKAILRWILFAPVNKCLLSMIFLGLKIQCAVVKEIWSIGRISLKTTRWVLTHATTCSQQCYFELMHYNDKGPNQIVCQYIKFMIPEYNSIIKTYLTK